MSGATKAIVVYQPWATLIALEVKGIETRPLPPNGPMRPEGVRGYPGCTVEPGERIAIVAGARPPQKGLTLGWEWAVGVESNGPALHADDANGECSCPDPDEGAWSDECKALNDWHRALLRDAGAHGWSIESALPLGVVVCTAVLADALPAVDPDRPWNPYDTGGCLFDEGDGLLTYSCGDISDKEASQFDAELPLGDFTPGRWGWLLADIQRTNPIPCKGRQGVFRLPDDVAAALSPAPVPGDGEGTEPRT